MNASLVFDGREVMIPASMDAPLPDQMQGTAFDQLGELASRICYDSFGVDPVTGKRKGRPSDALHAHILEVDNSSVHEHQNFTVRFPSTNDLVPYMFTLINRKGIFVEYIDHGIEVTTNLRAILKWDRCNSSVNLLYKDANDLVRNTLQSFGCVLAPKIIKLSSLPKGYMIPGVTIKRENLTENQAWISLWLYGSRGFTHEQVRHRFAMSQRSTRYVDESESPYIEHPLITKFLLDKNVNVNIRLGISDQINRSTNSDRGTYDSIVAALVPYLREQGLDATNARKQARGAARGYLGNALASEMIYSASVANWKWILSQRKNKSADAEIREIYTPALEALKSSQYGHFYEGFKTGQSSDGIGTVLI